ncbi:MAG: UDP-N-acetylenolpyruvoylglucosamine reductase [Candidatus Moranbacteria bacterium RIFOXYA12_FULL_35_19]|nr:MAG: UDP-N-acetylenolpyruvoylglucosamine reductase [Candidatus Moranbacteria bacterium GW2011_GWF2_35_39]OGI31819.1 MAG: UDP-N-acetylenolpyruvoylglucosamine reductase [Candidatus Moranbacteria bacterium RIFOXYB12_FULL_35_8]OGI32697.1 MAG: UDP-N-acetylenolpyruvoylglucosamine reductase [Candidatus Moranbacteria bacterium RIFOXYC12_FULL_36_13]OGI36701.1 MAG: UDP-N-acetylenolpyruvoylglucosamine reductase [Candidatus Moranbacteria bacterium RIFOXYA12_FULL_35_19]
MPILKIQKNISLAPLTTFKIGGPAKYFVEVSDEEALLEALQFAKENNLEIFVLGGGSNILISDDGFDGLVIKIQDARYKIQENKIEVSAGASLSSVVNLAMQNSLSGLEWASGIPGTVGGAIRGNAGIPLGCMADNAESVEVIKVQPLVSQRLNLRKSECKFAYRNSIFKENKDLIIISAVLKLEKGDQEEINNKIKEIIKKRSDTVHPNPKKPSSGSFFKNPKVENQELINRFEKDTGQKAIDSKIPAGWLIDEVGLRGKKIGGAAVSEKHANFVVNVGNAKAQDIVMLSSVIKMKVRDELGVQLQEEVQYVGF